MKPGRGKALDPIGFERFAFREPLSMMDAPRKPPRLWLAWLSGILLLGVVGIVIARRGEELRFVDLLQHVHPGWLLLAVLPPDRHLHLRGRCLAAGPVAAAHPHLALAAHPTRTRQAFMDQVVRSAGLSGTLLVVRALKRRGVPDGASVSAVVVGLLGFRMAYGLALVTALVLLGVSGDLSRRMLSLAILASFLIGAMILGLLWLSRGRRGPVGVADADPGAQGILAGAARRAEGGAPRQDAAAANDGAPVRIFCSMPRRWASAWPRSAATASPTGCSPPW